MAICSSKERGEEQLIALQLSVFNGKIIFVVCLIISKHD